MSVSPKQVTVERDHLESQVSGIAASLDSFIKESREFRDRTEREQTNIWAAIREQGDNMRNAVEKLSTRGQLSWQLIFSAITVLLAVTSGAAVLGQIFVDLRMEQFEIHNSYIREYQKEDHATLVEVVKRLRPSAD